MVYVYMGIKFSFKLNVLVDVFTIRRGIILV
jgi:hypothetical protein